MKVGLYLGEWEPESGGAHTFQHEVLSALGSLRSEHTLVALHRGEPPSPAPPMPLQQVVRHERPKRRRTWTGRKRRRIPEEGGAFSDLDRAVRSEELDLMWFLSPAYEAVSVPFFCTVWDLQHRVQPFFPEVSVTGWAWQDRDDHYASMLPRAARVLTGTQAGRAELVHYYRLNPDNVAVVPFPTPTFSHGDAIAPDEVAQRLEITRPYVLYPAQFWPHKNHVGLLRGLDLLRREHGIALDAIFVGNDVGNAAHVRAVAQELGLSESVHFPGFVSRADLTALYRGAVALVFASFFGPDNVPPLEAFALGCPVVAARVDGAEEQLGDAAQLFDPTRPGELAQALADLSSGPERRQALIARGHARAKSRSAVDYVSDVEALLDAFEPIRSCWSARYEHS